uniref:Reverse transcriptase zinc-binding domain-containing protein n=1 Tax=Solanum lycopersicum TaxID=4081 RepID=A0A3Q7I408_SOLLC
MGLINMNVWNRAAIAMLCWDLANNEDKLWIKWIHAYYLKGHNESSWMIRKIMHAKEIVDQVKLKEGKGMVKQIYDYLRGEQTKPKWKCLMFKNAASPKAIFTLWILLNKKLETVDRLAK